ncbi:MAG: MFS transporter [Bryobacteraceae bacterium]
MISGGHLAQLNATELIAARARRRVMHRIMPFLLVAYLCAYIDRANLGIAKLEMQRDLAFTESIIGLGAGIFFIGYFSLEIPGSLLVERWSARKWFSRIMICWGLVAVLSGFINNVGEFYVARFMLGASEAGFFPGVVVYLSHWFRPEDRTRAKSWFMTMQPLSVVVGVPLARWILETVHWNSLHSWRWVFILEGFPSIVLGVIALFYLTDRVHDARWLPDDEKNWLASELAREAAERSAADRVSVFAAFRQPQTIQLILVYFLIVTGNQAILFFLPSIAVERGNLSVVIQTAIVTAPYLCSVVGIFLNGYLAARTGERRWHTAVPILLAGLSLGSAVLTTQHLGVMFAFLCLMGFSFQAYLPVFWTLPGLYLGRSASAVAIGVINSFGNLGGFVGPYAFGYMRTATGTYRSGLLVLTGCLLASGLLAATIRIENQKSS